MTEDARITEGQGLRTCLYCCNWTDEARANARGEHWCRAMNTWTAAGFYCAAYDEQLMGDQPAEWYSIAEVAGMCHVDTDTVGYWISTGRLKAYPISSDEVKVAGQFRLRWRIDKAVADRYAAWYNSIV